MVNNINYVPEASYCDKIIIATWNVIKNSENGKTNNESFNEFVKLLERIN